MEQWKKAFDEKVKAIEAMLLQALPEEKGYQKTIYQAMRYSLMAGGKRLRPLLMQESYFFFGGNNQALITPMMKAIEMIHTYSLIHDDLPAMDNDDYRRGRLTSHKVFGEDMAILAGDALLNFAYETAAEAFEYAKTPEDTQNVIKALKILMNKAGVYGMVGGQVVDVELTGQAISEDILKFIFKLKTGALIEASMMIGACLAGVSEEVLLKTEKIACLTGMAFQIQDDILDVTSTTEVLGKPVHSDEKNAKTTWVTLYGLEQAQKDVSNYSEEAMKLLVETAVMPQPEDSFLYQFIEWLIHRIK